MVSSTFPNRLWILALFTLGLLILHWLSLLFVGPVGVATYYVMIPVLETLEHLGLRTLTGTRDGWAMPTTLGLVLSFVGWALFYFILLFGMRVLARKVSVDATRST